ncbi:hypothetical protein IJ670_04590 [bacterium]|nr:hypothetical protein [bacterium]
MELLAREQIKTLLAQEGIKLKELAVMLSEKTGKKLAPNALSQKLRRGTITYNDVLVIAKLLEYKISFQKMDERL